MSEITIRKLGAADQPAWEALWRDNLLHFGAGEGAFAALPGLWQRLLAPDEPLHGWLMLLDHAPAGLAHVVLRAHTFSPRPVGILEDLWVAQAARGRGLAQAMIRRLVQEGQAGGWTKLEWQTDTGNLTAQAVYDRIAEPVAVRRYQISLA